MDTATARAVRFRHVVFPDSVGGLGRALDAARAREAACAAARARHPLVPCHPPCSPRSLTPADEAFLASLCARVGIGMRHYKPETLCRRLPACLLAIRAESVSHARWILQRDPRLDRVAADALIIGVTSFFRDAPVFDALRRQVLPRLLATRKGRPLRVWSIGCSDGAELYSVAMLLDELGALSAGAGGPTGPVELVGTDCRPEAASRAAAGLYDAAAVRAVPPELAARCLVADGSRYRVVPHLREAAQWQVADVLDPAAAWCGPERPADLVLCRNLVIYLQPAATAALWAMLAAALRPGGVMVLGKAERPLGVPGLANAGPCLYRKRVD